MKRTAAAFLIFAFALSVPAAAISPAPEISAKAAVLLDAESGETLYEHNADARMLIASTTKIMTALVVLERCGLTESVKIDERSAGREGSSAYLRAGEVWTVEELLCGLMLSSGNDAAAALAIHAAGSEDGFAELMNEKAAELGLENTHFANPSGLDAEGHYSSARDMARLAAYAMENADFARIVSSRSATVQGREIYNHNKLLGSYPGCIGVKTGYTMAAGRTLVSCAERDGARYVCVTLCDRDDWRDHAALCDWAFAEYERRCVIDSGVSYRVASASGGYLEVKAESDGFAVLPRGAEVEIKLELPPFVLAPASAGETAGRIYAVSGGKVVCEMPLVFTSGLPAPERSGLLKRLAGLFGRPIYLTGE